MREIQTRGNAEAVALDVRSRNMFIGRVLRNAAATGDPDLWSSALCGGVL
ncbi:hypothetical protein [Microlunatus phosphovorus]|nr:hypothetical protein [Microlunatus phosphovorus]